MSETKQNILTGIIAGIVGVTNVVFGSWELVSNVVNSFNW